MNALTKLRVLKQRLMKDPAVRAEYRKASAELWPVETAQMAKAKSQPRNGGGSRRG